MKQKIQLLSQWQSTEPFPENMPIKERELFCPPTYLNIKVLISDANGSFETSSPMTFKANVVDLLSEFRDFEKQKKTK